MLVGLAIRDVVLVDRLDLVFERGLSVLTGETGAGKSILLDALGLALGARAEQRLVRAGAERAQVSATFALEPGHPALALVEEQEIGVEGGELILRRSLTAEGRSRAFVNDEPASVGLLRRLAELLVEVQGQFDQRGLLDTSTHRRLLDAYGVHAEILDEVAGRWREWRGAEEARQRAAETLERARRDEAFLRHAVEELSALAPKAEEETELAEARRRLRLGEALVETVEEASRALAGGDGEKGPGARIVAAERALERALGQAGAESGDDGLEPILAALERARLELEDAEERLQSLAASLEHDPGRLERLEERLFALRELARKHAVSTEGLPALLERLSDELQTLELGESELGRLAERAWETRLAFEEAAAMLSEARRRAARRLDEAVGAELAPLKLEKARFETRLEPLDKADWTAEGAERVGFLVATNPGQAAGPLGRIASGGELSRFLLAIKVALAEVGEVETLVFDEVDSGVGGATAHAVGERLARLARDRQILVVTHSPQVAARAAHHWRVFKLSEGETTLTRVGRLPAEDRHEEIARMLAGAEVTEEARAAARRLMEAG